MEGTTEALEETDTHEAVNEIEADDSEPSGS